MSTTLEQVAPLVAGLSASDRSALRNMLDELDGDTPTDDEWEEAWASECERRIADLDAGRTKLVSHEEFMARWKEKYG